MGEIRRRARKQISAARLSEIPPWDVIKNACGRLYWTHLFIECNGNIVQVAKISGVNRGHCYRIMRSFGILPFAKTYNANWDAPLESFSDEPTKQNPRMPKFEKLGSRTGALFKRVREASRSTYDETTPDLIKD